MSGMAPSAVTENGGDASVVDKKERLSVLFAEGKRAYIIGDLTIAADKFGEASELAVEAFGEFAAEAFDPHYYYGKTMLEMASVEDRVFTNAMQNTNKEEDDDQEDETANEQVGNPEELTENEQEEIAENVADALEENAAELDQAQNPTDTAESQDVEGEAPTGEGKSVEEGEKAEGKNGSGETNGEERESDEKAEETPMDEDANNEESMAQEETAGGEESSQEDEPELMQLAWEALEVARAICDKHAEVEGFKAKKADVLLELIECSIQNSNYKQAMDDVEVCIEVCKGIDDLKDRRLDAAYFNKARAYDLDKQFDQAALTYTEVKRHVERRLAAMEKELIEETDPEKKDKLQKEVGNLKELTDEIQVKVDDALESARNAAQVEREQCENTSKMGELKATMPGEASDITGLVRKKAVKRPAEEHDANTTNEKKPKEDEKHQEPAAVAQ